MRRFLILLLVLATTCSLVACSASNDKGDKTLDADISQGDDGRLVSQIIKFDGQAVVIGDLSVSWMQKSGFVLLDDVDYSKDHEMKANAAESFTFVKTASSDMSTAAMITLTFLNESDKPQPFSSAVLTEVKVELGDEMTQQRYDDINVEAPFEIGIGVPVSNIERVLGTPTHVEVVENSNYTVYDWITDEGDLIQVRIGESLGLIQFSFTLNQ